MNESTTSSAARNRTGTTTATSSNWLSLSFVLLCLLLAAALRLYAAMRSGLWLDEALFLGVTHLPSISALLDFLRAHESHPPLFYLLMRGWQALFGPSDAAVLIPQVALGAALTPAIYAVGRRVYGRTAGMIAAALVATASLFIRYSMQVRPYALMPLLTLLSVYLAWTLLHRPERRGVWAAYGASLVALLYTHNWSALFLAAHWICLSLYLLIQVRSHRLPPAAFLPWLAVHAAVLLVYLPWVPTLRFQAAHAGHGAIGYGDMLRPLVEKLSHLAGSGKAAALVFGVIVAAAAAVVAGVRRGRARGLRSASSVSGPAEANAPRDAAADWVFLGIPLATFLLAFLLAPLSNTLLVRCNQAAVPGLIVWLTGPLAGALRASNRRRPGFWLAAATIAVLVGFGLADTRRMMRSVKSVARENAAALTEKAAPNDLIVLAPDILAPSFNRYFTLPNEQIDYPQLGREDITAYDDVYARESDPAVFWRAAEKIRAAHAAGRRLWFVTPVQVDNYRALPEPGPVPPNVTQWAPYQTADQRATELFALVKQVYGEPRPNAVPMIARQANEGFHIFLFDPENRAPSSPPGR